MTLEGADGDTHGRRRRLALQEARRERWGCEVRLDPAEHVQDLELRIGHRVTDTTVYENGKLGGPARAYAPR